MTPHEGITCPECGRTTGQKVVDSRGTKIGTRRRRLCPCGARFTTYEARLDVLRQELIGELQAEIEGLLLKYQLRASSALAGRKDAPEVMP